MTPSLPGAGEANPNSEQPRATAYAGFWIRFLALTIDIALLFAFVWAGVLLLAFAVRPLLIDQAVAWETLGVPIDVVTFAVNFGLPWLYEAIFTASAWQATPGKRLLGLKVNSAGGRRVGFGRATARHLAKYLWFGLLIQPLTERRQALHDKIAGTVVVQA